MLSSQWKPNMKQLTPTHEIIYRSNIKLKADVLNLLIVITMYSFRTPTLINARKLFIYFFRLKIGSTTKEGKQSRACISLDNTVTDPANINKHLSTFFSCHLRALSKLSNRYICVQVLTKTIAAQDWKKLQSWTQGTFLQLSWGKHSVVGCTG